MSEGTEPNKPILSFSVGAFSVSLWENAVENDDGTSRTYKSVTLRKSFYNRKENRLDAQTVTVNPPEIGCLVSLLQKMGEAVIQNRGDAPF